ncbi:MAG: hypothetical protein JWO26_3498, partial [Rhodospirillales bacterium]|nr:hypothetical protein [Rhodospirillales bacterium]
TGFYPGCYRILQTGDWEPTCRS